jgi:hypothetical protein
MYSKNNFEAATMTDRDFAARMNFFIRHFYLDDALQLNGTGFSGEIDRVSLFISFDKDINSQTIAEIKSIPTDKESLNNPDILKNSAVRKYLALLEVMAHEHFHLLQILLCPSVNIFYKASRKLAVLRTHVFNGILRHKIERTASDNNLFDFVFRFPDSERDFIMQCLTQSRMETLIAYNFFRYEDDPAALNIVDLCEGAAMAFQKTASIADYRENIDIDKELSDKRYFGAWQYYKAQGGSIREVFFLLAHLVLKYGCLDDGNYMGAVPTPQKLFTELCANIDRYEAALHSGRFAPFASFSPFTSFAYQGLPDQASDLCATPEILEVVKSLDELMWIITKDIRQYDKAHNIYHDIGNDGKIRYEKTFMFAPIQSISEKFSAEFPEYNENYFIALLIADNTYRERVIASLAKIINTVKTTCATGAPATIATDNEILCLVDDIDEYIRSEFSFCCSAHKGKKSSKDEIRHCNNKYGLRNRFQQIADEDLYTLF